jgi:hypothetical protein
VQPLHAFQSCLAQSTVSHNRTTPPSHPTPSPHPLTPPQTPTAAFQDFKTDFNEGFGEIAGVLFKIAKYAATRFNLGDLVFGVYHLAAHHNTSDATDGIEVGGRVCAAAVIDRGAAARL